MEEEGQYPAQQEGTCYPFGILSATQNMPLSTADVYRYHFSKQAPVRSSIAATRVAGQPAQRSTFDDERNPCMNCPSTHALPTPDDGPAATALWSRPLPGSHPCGEDLEYDPRFVSLISLSRGREEHQLGSSIVPGQDPDWKQVHAAAEQLMTETRDLRVIVIWTHAALRLRGLQGFADGTSVLARVLSTFWDTVHPLIEPDGDTFMRSSAIAALGDPESLLRALRDARFLDSSSGDISVRDACLLLDGDDAPDCPLATIPQLHAAIQKEYPRNAMQFAAIQRIASNLLDIRNSFARYLDASSQPNLSRLEAIIGKLDVVSRAPSPAAGTAAEPVVASVSHPSTEDGEGVTASRPQTVGSRGEALAALVSAREYFETHEPSHPAVLLIGRIERLCGSSFLDIIADLAPDALNQVRLLAGLSTPS